MQFLLILPSCYTSSLKWFRSSSRNLPKICCMWHQAEPCIIIMIIVWQNYFCACQGSGSHCGCGFDFGTASASGSGNGSRSDGTFHNLLHFMVVRWQTAQKSAAKIQMNSKLLKRQSDSRCGGEGGCGSARMMQRGQRLLRKQLFPLQQLLT